jgi:hypothetical protein
MNAYSKLKEKHQKEIGELPIFFAFDHKQFAKGMARFGLSPEDTNKIYALKGTGGYYLRSDDAKLRETFARHMREFNEAIAADKTSEGFIFEMFARELFNHEYIFTRDPEPAWEALRLTEAQINSNKALRKGFKKAVALFGRNG